MTEWSRYRATSEPELRDGEAATSTGCCSSTRSTSSLFTSASTLRNFARVLGEEQAADLLRQTVVACIGPVTAAAARQLQIEPAVVAKDYSIGGLVDAVVEHYAAR